MDDDIAGYIDLLYGKGLDLEYKERQIREDRQIESKERRTKTIEESRLLKDWFKSQFDVVNEKFRKHLQF